MLEAQTMMFDYSKTIQEKFDRFHLANPHIYRHMVTLARMAKSRGYNHWSTKGIFEVMRWEMSVHTDEKVPTLSNNYTSRYARLVMEQEEDLKDFFITRELTA